jgi:ankyrin repeat protein
MSNACKVFTVVLAIGVFPPVVEPAAAQTEIDGPALIAAARRADGYAIRSLLREGADVNTRYGDGTTALHWAVHLDSGDLVDLLITSGADVNTTDDHGVTPLALASLNGSAALVRTLLEAGADVNAARASGETALMTAARGGSLDVVQSLLAAGADPNAAEGLLGQAALMLAIAENHTRVAEVLIEAGAAVSARTNNRFTPLLFAAQQGNIEAAQLLISAGANVNESAPDGIGGNTNARTRFVRGTDAHALLVAIDSGHSDMALFLLDGGADPHHAGAGRTPLHSAVQHRNPEVVSALLRQGADPNVGLERPLPFVSRRINQDNGLTPDVIGATPFFLAASFGDLESMRFLVEGGADPTLTTDDGTTALMVAAGVDYVEGADKYGRRWFEDNLPLEESALAAVEYILGLALLDINAVNDDSQTALHGAVYLGGTLLVPFLLERGANIDAINDRGQTPWMIAAEGEYRAGSFYTHQETGKLLEELGADTTLGEDLGRSFRIILTEREANGR